LVQRKVFGPSSILNYSVGGTVYTRANGVAAQDGTVCGPSLRFRASADLIWHTALDQDKSSDVPGRQKLLASSALLTNRDAAI
jgi:hypothetical protein